MRDARIATAIVLASSAALLGGALAFQHLGGLYPCEMCLWQRWPHVGALGLGLLAWALGCSRPVTVLAALALLASAAIAGFHAGVEYHWWPGITACAAAPLAGGGDLVAMLATPLVRCDAAAWSLFGISLAGYNALISTAIGGLALWLTLKSREPGPQGLKPSTR